MKNLKKLLAVIVAICVLATFTVPAFAEETTAAKTDAEIATELGVILGEGGGVTADYLASQPTRLQGAIMFLRLKGLEGAAKAFTGTDNFEDVSVVNDTNKAILAYLKANPDLGFQGVGNNTFAPLKEMTAKEYYKILLVALGYEENTDFTWANVLSFAASKGLTKLIDNEKFTVNDLCIGTVEALKATVKGGTDTLIAKLVEGNSISADKATASGLYNPVAKALEVVSATADNLKAAKVVFNKELNADTVVKANFSNTNVDDVKLLDDKKTVVVVLKDAKKQSETLDIVIDNVKAADGTKVAKVTKTVTFVDTTIPVVTGAVAKNAKTIVISASEPLDAYSQYVKVFSDIKVDGNAVIATSAIDYATNSITLKLTSILAKGAHKLDISGLKDFAGYVAVATSFNIDVAEDTTAPAIASAKVNSPTEIEVTFNEDIDSLNKGSFTVNGTDATVKSQSETDASKITITLGKTLDIGATVEIKIGFKGQKDVVGNEVKDTTYFTFKVSDDTTLPTVAATVESGNKIVLTFSKSVLKAGTVKIYNVSDSKQIGGNISLADSNITWESTNTVAKIPATLGGTGLDNTDAKDIKINITDVKDATVRANELGEQNINVKALDTKKPTLSPSYTIKAGTAEDKKDDTITFYFSEAIDAETAKNLSNYVVTTPGSVLTAKQALATYSDVSFKELSSDGKNVTLYVKGLRDESASTALEFTVYAIKDLAGNMLVTGTASIVPAGNPSLSTYAATGTNTVELVYTEEIGYAAPGAFIIRESNTTNATVSAVVISTAIDGRKVTLTLDRSIGTTTAKAYLSQLDRTLVKNPYGTTSATESAYQLTDKIKPTITYTATSAGILIEFSEEVSTSAATLFNEITLTKGGNAIDTFTASSISAIGSENKVWKIGNLEINTEYKIQMYPRGTVDTRTNAFQATDLKAVTTKP